MDLFNVVTLNEALKIIEENTEIELLREDVDLCMAEGRIIYEDILSSTNVPNFRRSIVDGYAVRFRDTIGASESIPAILNIKGEVIMGEKPIMNIEKSGECFYIPTGGMLPEGADAIVMIEYTDKLDETTLIVNSSVAFLDNVVIEGEDIGKGEKLICRGDKIRPYEIGVFSSIGIGKIGVFKKPKIGVISTGNEIVDWDKTPTPGKVRDINTYLLYSSIQRDGGEAVNYGVVNDDFNILKEIMEKALNECDAVVVSGGSSVGKKDQTLKVINSFEDKGTLVHGLSVKPGKPTIIGKCRGKLVFGLPGHPLACSIIYTTLVKKYMESMMEFKEEQFPVSCVFPINYHKAKGREEYLPVIIKIEEGKLQAYPVFTKSGLITGFSKAWGYIRIPKNEEGIKENDRVFAYKF